MSLLPVSLLPCIDRREVLSTLRELSLCVNALINRGKLGFTLQSKMVLVNISLVLKFISPLHNEHVALDICAVSEVLQRNVVMVLTKVAIQLIHNISELNVTTCF